MSRLKWIWSGIKWIWSGLKWIWSGIKSIFTDGRSVWDSPVGRITFLVLVGGSFVFLGAFLFVLWVGGKEGQGLNYLRSMTLDKWLIFLAGVVGALVTLTFKVSQATLEQRRGDLDQRAEASTQMLNWVPFVNDARSSAAAWLALEELAKSSPFIAQGVVRVAVHTIDQFLYEKADTGAPSPNPSLTAAGGVTPPARKGHLTFGTPAASSDSEAPATDAVPGVTDESLESSIATPNEVHGGWVSAIEAWRCLRNLLESEVAAGIDVKIGREAPPGQDGRLGKEFPGEFDVSLREGHNLDLCDFISGELNESFTINCEGGLFVPPRLVPSQAEWDIFVGGTEVASQILWKELHVAGTCNLHLQGGREVVIEDLRIDGEAVLNLTLGVGGRLRVVKFKNSGSWNITTALGGGADSSGSNETAARIGLWAKGDIEGGIINLLNSDMVDSHITLDVDGIDSSEATGAVVLHEAHLENSSLSLTLANTVPTLSGVRVVGESLFAVALRGESSNLILELSELFAKCKSGKVPRLSFTSDSPEVLSVKMTQASLSDGFIEIVSNSNSTPEFFLEVSQETPDQMEAFWLRVGGVVNRRWVVSPTRSRKASRLAAGAGNAVAATKMKVGLGETGDLKFDPAHSMVAKPWSGRRAIVERLRRRQLAHLMCKPQESRHAS